MSRLKLGDSEVRLVVDPDMEPNTLVLLNLVYATRHCRACWETSPVAAFIDHEDTLHRRCANCRACARPESPMPQVVAWLASLSPERRKELEDQL